MDLRRLVQTWFQKWEEGDFRGIPVTDGFVHTSPYGTITGKDAYLELVEANADQFLGYRFEIHDELYGEDRACIRYTARADDFALDVSEWFHAEEGAISSVASYYNVGEASYQDMEF